MPIRVCLALLGILMAGTAGCSWKMDLPSDKSRCAPPGSGAHLPAIEKVTDLEWGFEAGRRFGYRVGEGRWFASAILHDSSNDEATIVVWDLSTGRRSRELSPASRFPKALRGSPEPIAISISGNKLATCRDQFMQIWSLPDGELICEFPFGREPSPWKLDENGKPIEFRGVERPVDAEFSEEGLTISAWIGSELAVMTWDTRTGKLLGKLPQATPQRDTPWDKRVRIGGQRMMLTNWYSIKTPSREVRLFGWWESVSSMSHAEFSPDGELLYIGFESPGYFIDFTPDVTPAHIRAFDTRSGKLISWLFVEEDRRTGTPTRAIGFVGDTDLVWIERRGRERLISIADFRSKSEGSTVVVSRGDAIVMPIAGTCSLLVLESERPAVWSVDPSALRRKPADTDESLVEPSDDVPPET
jgi:WD40 repeat protein